MTIFFFLLSGLFSGIATHGGRALYALPVALLAFVFGWINRPKREEAPAPRTGTLQTLGVTSDHTPPPAMVPSFVDPQDWGEKTRVAEKRRQSWLDLETELDTHLYSAMHMLRALLPNAHSALIFYPGPVAPVSLCVHRFDSVAPGKIDEKIVITQGQGLLGQLLKGSLHHILEGDIAHTRLFYYKEEVAVQSIAAVPIILQGRINGAIVVDSLEQNAFSEETIAHLIVFSKLICELSYQTSTNLLQQHEREQYKELFEYQRKFMDNMSMDDIFRSIAAFIAQNIPYDRIMILVADEEQPTALARVEYVTGLGAEGFENLEMSIDGKGLLSLCFLNRSELHRTFSSGEEIFRLRDDEPRDQAFRSLIAFPVFEDEHSPVRMAVCVESASENHYTELSRNLLRNICNSAGFAYTRVNAYQEKQNLASRDGLTGLLNHRAFQERLRTEILRAKRQGTLIGLMMLDVDKFKAVNDTYGHPIGDQVLKMIADQISSAIREEIDLVARYGGEEFVVMITGATQEVVQDTAERIRRSVEQTGVNIGHPDLLHVTISIGFALYPLHSEEVKSVLDKADKALYNAKENGRNRVVGYH